MLVRTVLLLSIFSSLQCIAQDGQWLNADKPGRSTNPNTVGKGVWQIQAGYTYEDLDRVYRQYTELFEKNNIGDIKLRYGIGQKVEISARTRYTHYEQTSDDAFTREPFGQFDLFGLAGRYSFTDPADGGFQIGTELEFIFTEWSENWVVPQTKWVVAASGPLGENFTLTGNLIYSYWSILQLTANLRYDFSDKVAAFVEYYPQFSFDNGSQSDGREYWEYLGESYLNGGIGLMLAKNLMMDVSGGWVVSDSSNGNDYDTSGFNAQIGLTTRFGGK